MVLQIIDWEYYIDRFGATIQKIISIPAALQNVPNPVPRVPFPDWLENKRQQRKNDHKQPKINEIYRKRALPSTPDIENIACRKAVDDGASGTVAPLNDCSNLEEGSYSVKIFLCLK